MADNLSEEILDIEHRGWQSLCDGTGAEFYGQIMTEDAIMTVVDGYALDRDAVIESLTNAPTWDSYEISEPKFIVLGPDQALLRYTGIAHRSGPYTLRALMVSVYVRVQRQWRLVHYQQTSIPTAA